MTRPILLQTKPRDSFKQCCVCKQCYACTQRHVCKQCYVFKLQTTLNCLLSVASLVQALSVIAYFEPSLSSTYIYCLLCASPRDVASSSNGQSGALSGITTFKSDAVLPRREGIADCYHMSAISLNPKIPLRMRRQWRRLTTSAVRMRSRVRR